MSRAKKEASRREQLLFDALKVQRKAHDGAKNSGVNWRAVREYRAEPNTMVADPMAVVVKMRGGLVRVR